ncbi:MAG: phosphoribosylaminoimidazolesuccinocarboxamide synthase, partial [Smithellaceae bacterium]|nr:phosphoribosylaminoimidazolesuccinocarboxamide synthase [Smithellaceae bacterium]
MDQGGIFQTDLPGLNIVARGKVRDIYEAGEECLLIVATDRISAFDVVMPDSIPGKGMILTKMSAFWFARTRDIIGNHLISTDPASYPERCLPYREVLRGRSMLVKRAKPVMVECVVRGYLTGSGWKDYLKHGSVSGIPLPAGLKESARLPEPLFTPSSKAPPGEHDTAMSVAEVEQALGADLTARLKETSLAIYCRAAEYALDKGIIIADCKFEFGILAGELILIDELLTPDSARFWPRSEYEEGRSQRSFDKQFLRDYLLGVKWNQTPPAPGLPEEIIQKTRA